MSPVRFVTYLSGRTSRSSVVRRPSVALPAYLPDRTELLARGGSFALTAGATLNDPATEFHFGPKSCGKSHCCSRIDSPDRQSQKKGPVSGASHLALEPAATIKQLQLLPYDDASSKAPCRQGSARRYQRRPLGQAQPLGSCSSRQKYIFQSLY